MKTIYLLNYIGIIRIRSLFCSLALLMAISLAQAGSFKDSELRHVEFPAWFSNDPFLELDEELVKARAAGRQGLMVLYTTEGCSYCGLFIKKSLGNPEIAALVQKHFQSIGLEIFDDADLVGPRGKETTVKEFATQEGVEFSPTILFYGPDGKQLFRVTGYLSPERFKTTLGYMAGKHYLQQPFAKYAKSLVKGEVKLQPFAQLRKDSLFGKPPYLLQRNVVAASQPLLVLFEKKGCDECEEFHDKVLGDKQIRASLNHYEVVRLDAQDDKSIVIMPDGSRTTPAEWFTQEGFSRSPAMIFYNERGYQALKTDALVLEQRMKNSIGFVNERAYRKGWNYQRFARSKAIERNLKKQKMKEQ